MNKKQIISIVISVILVLLTWQSLFGERTTTWQNGETKTTLRYKYAGKGEIHSTILIQGDVSLLQVPLLQFFNAKLVDIVFYDSSKKPIEYMPVYYNDFKCIKNQCKATLVMPMSFVDYIRTVYIKAE